LAQQSSRPPEKPGDVQDDVATVVLLLELVELASWSLAHQL